MNYLSTYSHFRIKKQLHQYQCNTSVYRDRVPMQRALVHRKAAVHRKLGVHLQILYSTLYIHVCKYTTIVHCWELGAVLVQRAVMRVL